MSYTEEECHINTKATHLAFITIQMLDVNYSDRWGLVQSFRSNSLY